MAQQPLLINALRTVASRLQPGIRLATMDADWEHLFGVSAGAGLAGSRLLAAEISFAECQEKCRLDAACTALDYVRKHVDTSVSGTSTRRKSCTVLKKPRKRSCWAVNGDAWLPCLQPETENIIARKRPPVQAPSGAKNVLMVIFDDLRVVDEPFQQRAVPKATALAASSTTFLSVHAQCALCAPSRASFLSGRRPDVTRVLWTDNFLREWPPAQSWVTLPQHFKRSGYYVAGAGKLYHHLADPMSLDPMSFTEPECIADYPYYGQGYCPEKPEYLYAVYNTSVSCPVELDRHPGFAFPDQQVLAKAQQFLASAAPKARAGIRPFWIGVGFFKPHKPFVFPSSLLRRMPPLADIQLARNGEPPKTMAPMANIAELCADKLTQRSSLNCARDTIRTYHAAAAFTDSLLGELLKDIERLQVHQDTLLVVLSDHGFALGEHGSWAKWTNWEVATRTVLMLRAPWLPQSAAQRVSSVVELVDLFPTVAELAGVKVNAQLPGYEELGGRSLAHLLRKPTNNSGLAAFTQIPRCWPVGSTSHNSTSFSAIGQCDKIPSSEYAFMGYSIRTSISRYTEWVPVRWDAVTHRHVPQWEESVGSELYEHTSDDGGSGWTRLCENENVAQQRPNAVASSRRRLRAQYEATHAAAVRTAQHKHGHRASSR